MNSIKSRRQPLRKGNSPRKLADLAVVITNHEAADSPDRMTYRQRWGGGRKGREKRQPLHLNHGQASCESSGKSTEPTQSTARKKQRKEWCIAGELDSPPQLRAQQTAEDACEGCINCVLRQTGTPQLASEQPHSDERTNRDENAKAGDLEAPDAKEDGIDNRLLLRRASRAARRV